MSESAKRHEENFNLSKEIRASMDAAIRNQGASIKTLEIKIGKMSKVLLERGFGSLPSSTEVNLRDQVKSILTTIEADSCSILTTVKKRSDHMDHNSRKLTLKLHNPYPERRKTQEVSLYLAVLIMYDLIMPFTYVGIKRLHDDLGVTAAKVRVTVAKQNLVLLVKKPKVETCKAKASADKPKVVRKNNGAPIIEE
ncbi:hypothetical protein Tco_0210502 [Tanacetum coccineum]